jgi:glycosyltransferase involved in cell wall biosynthesis
VGSYLAFLGRTSPEKGIEAAIEIARAVELPLLVAAKVDDVDADYFAERIKPLLARGGEVEFVGEINEEQKDEFLGNAAATLFPIDWPEPFGLVMIESAARGTPVLAFRSGSVPEVIEDGVSGLIVDNVQEAVAAMPRLLELPRDRVRAAVEHRFGVDRMARDYVAAYQRLVNERATAEHRDVADLAITQGTPLEPSQTIDSTRTVSSESA